MLNILKMSNSIEQLFHWFQREKAVKLVAKAPRAKEKARVTNPIRTRVSSQEKEKEKAKIGMEAEENQKARVFKDNATSVVNGDTLNGSAQ